MLWSRIVLPLKELSTTKGPDAFVEDVQDEYKRRLKAKLRGSRGSEAYMQPGSWFILGMKSGSFLVL